MLFPRLLLFLILLGLWLGLTGHVTLMSIVLGGFIAAVGVRIFGRTVCGESSSRFSLRDIVVKCWNLVTFVGVFFYEVFSSAVMVARYAFRRDFSLQPGVVRIPTILENRTAIVILGNLITLTPGTLTLDYNPEKSCYYVHWIHVTTGTDEEEVRDLIHQMESRLRRIMQ